MLRALCALPLLAVVWAALPVKNALELGQKQFNSGNYARAVELLQPLVQAQPSKLPPLQERQARTVLGNCYRAVLDHQAALLHTQRLVDLALELEGPRSQAHALALKAVCVDHVGLHAFSEARVTITQSLAIMEGLGLQRHEEYGSALAVLGDMEQQLGRHREALLAYSRAKDVLGQFKTGYYYGVLLNNMAMSFDALRMWNEAIEFGSESVERSRAKLGSGHPEYALRLRNVGEVYAKLKDFEHAIPHYKEALAIFKRVLGEGHDRTVVTAARLADVQADATGEVATTKAFTGWPLLDPSVEMIEQAEKERHAGRHQRAVQLLTPLLRTKLSVYEEWRVVRLLGSCHHALGAPGVALPFAQRAVTLALQLSGPRSHDHATALKLLARVKLGLKAFSDALSAVEEALSICEELGLRSVECGRMLAVRNELDPFAQKVISWVLSISVVLAGLVSCFLCRRKARYRVRMPRRGRSAA